MKNKCYVCFFISIISICFGVGQPVLAEDQPGLSVGQTIYVPAYSHIYSGNREKPFLLTVTLSIRNVDPKHSISIDLINFYESQGNLPSLIQSIINYSYR